MDADPLTFSADTALDLEAEVREAIHSLDILRGTRAEVNIAVSGGHVTLHGVVQSPMAAVEAERAAADVPGVTEVTNELVDDGSLTRQVAEVLARDPRTRGIPPGYEVTSIFGHLTLIGRFTAAEANAVLAVTQAVPGVRTVNLKTY